MGAGVGVGNCWNGWRITLLIERKKVNVEIGPVKEIHL